MKAHARMPDEGETAKVVAPLFGKKKDVFKWRCAHRERIHRRATKAASRSEEYPRRAAALQE